MVQRDLTRAYLVDPRDDCVLRVIRKVLDVSGLSGGEPEDAGHHPLDAHHLHGVRHHQRVYQGQVGALWRQEKNS